MEKHSLGTLHLNFNSRARKIAVLLAIMSVSTLLGMQIAQAQSDDILHFFSGGMDGSLPTSGVTLGGTGTLYGTTTSGGSGNSGVVYRLTERHSAWTLSSLYEFTGLDDGGVPQAGITIGPNGALYGTTAFGGTLDAGTVFELRPPLTVCKAVTCYWIETAIHSFTGNPDGLNPGFGNLIFDSAGNIYGTTSYGGTNDKGVVFELSPSGGSWTETILHNFGSGDDGATPESGVIFDSAGNLYGTTNFGGNSPNCESGCGIVYQLVPSNGSWTENIILYFDGSTSGYEPQGTLTIDGSGNLYGTTLNGGPDGGNGSVFELSPSDGGWTYIALVNFSGECNPRPGVTMSAAGHLYGVCYYGGANTFGELFDLAYNGSMWVYSNLYSFGATNDGHYPEGPVVLDASGNIYGTTVNGGMNQNGVVWEFAP